MTERVSNVIRLIPPDYMIFTSGILVSAAINIYTDVFLSTPLSASANRVILSATSFLLSSLFLMILSLNLQSLRELALEQSPRFIEFETRKELHTELIAKRLTRLVILLSFSVATALFGILVLASTVNYSDEGNLRDTNEVSPTPSNSSHTPTASPADHRSSSWLQPSPKVSIYSVALIHDLKTAEGTGYLMGMGTIKLPSDKDKLLARAIVNGRTR